MFIKDGKRFNPYAVITVGDVTYEGNILKFPAVVTQMGITKVDEPAPPEDYSSDRYFRVETDAAPYVAYEPKSPEQIRQAELARIPPVTPWRMRKALNQLGLRSTVEASVAQADQDTKDAWEFATEFVRTDPLILVMQNVLGKTDEEVDNLFLLGASL